MIHFGSLATIEADKLKKTEHREKARKSLVDAAGGVWRKHQKLAHMVQKIPEETAKKVVGEVEAVVKKEADGVKTHITDAFAPIMKLLTPGATETIAQAKVRNRLEMEALRCAEAQDKEDTKRVRKEQAAKKKEDAKRASEEKAAKKQRRT